MATIGELIEFADTLLNVTDFSDYCPNGLQIEGQREIRRIVTGVTASQRWIDMALAASADLLLVHHGLFWRGDPQPLTGLRGRRVASVMRAGAHLAAYHLPLDAHPVLGNNARLAEMLGWQVDGEGPSVGLHGHLEQPQPLVDLVAHIAGVLGQEPIVAVSRSGVSPGAVALPRVRLRRLPDWGLISI